MEEDDEGEAMARPRSGSVPHAFLCNVFDLLNLINVTTGPPGLRASPYAHHPFPPSTLPLRSLPRHSPSLLLGLQR